MSFFTIRGFGFESGAFINAYSGNRAESIHETLESDAVGAGILALIDQVSEWGGTGGDLLKHLERNIDDGVKKSPGWPKTPRALSAALRRLTTFLRESGIEIVFHKRKGKGGRRLLTIGGMNGDLTAPTATTVPAETTASINQQIREISGSGGPGHGVSDEPHQRRQPPLQPPLGIQQNGSGFPAPVAEVAVEAVICKVNLTPLPGPFDRIDLCAQCGPTEWQSVGTAWLCGKCGAPARKPALSSQNVSAVDCAATDEQSMSRTEAAE